MHCTMLDRTKACDYCRGQDKAHFINHNLLALDNINPKLSEEYEVALTNAIKEGFHFMVGRGYFNADQFYAEFCGYSKEYDAILKEIVDVMDAWINRARLED